MRNGKKEIIIKNELGIQIYRYDNALIVISTLYKPVVGLLVFIEVTLMIKSYQSSSMFSDIFLLYMFCGINYRVIEKLSLCFIFVGLEESTESDTS